MKKLVYVLLAAILTVAVALALSKGFLPDVKQIKSAQMVMNSGRVYQLSEQDTNVIFNVLNKIEKNQKYEVVNSDDAMSELGTVKVEFKTLLRKYSYTFNGYDLLYRNKRLRIDQDYFKGNVYSVLYHVADGYEPFGGEICDLNWQGTIKSAISGKEYDINEIKFYPSYIIRNYYVKDDEPHEIAAEYILELQNAYRKYNILLTDGYVIIGNTTYKYIGISPEEHELCNYAKKLIEEYEQSVE